MPIDTSIYRNIQQFEMPSISDAISKGLNLRQLGMQSDAMQRDDAIKARSQKMSAMGQAMEQLSKLPEDQKPAAYEAKQKELVNSGIMSPDEAEPYSPDKFGQALAAWRSTPEFAALDESRAKAQNLRAEAAKHYAEAGKFKPPGLVQPSDDPAKLVPQVVPKEHQAQAFKEIDAAENTNKMAKSIMDSFDQAVGDTSGTGAVTSYFRDPRSVLALHQAMQPTFKDMEGTVRQAAMDNTFKNITPTGTDSPAEIATKRAALQAYLQSKISAPTARGYGIDLSKFDSTKPYEAPPLEAKGPGSGMAFAAGAPKVTAADHAEAINWAQANKSNPKYAAKAQQILQVNGIK